MSLQALWDAVGGAIQERTRYRGGSFAGYDYSATLDKVHLFFVHEEFPDKRYCIPFSLPKQGEERYNLPGRPLADAWARYLDNQLHPAVEA